MRLDLQTDPLVTGELPLGGVDQDRAARRLLQARGVEWEAATYEQLVEAYEGVEKAGVAYEVRPARNVLSPARRAAAAPCRCSTRRVVAARRRTGSSRRVRRSRSPGRPSRAGDGDPDPLAARASA
jgi:hypothetical protein